MPPRKIPPREIHVRPYKYEVRQYPHFSTTKECNGKCSDRIIYSFHGDWHSYNLPGLSAAPIRRCWSLKRRFLTKRHGWRSCKILLNAKIIIKENAITNSCHYLSNTTLISKTRAYAHHVRTVTANTAHFSLSHMVSFSAKQCRQRAHFKRKNVTARPA